MTRRKKALEIIKNYGSVEGCHHKQWVLDQVARILARDYDKWVAEYNKGGNIRWNRGTPP